MIKMMNTIILSLMLSFLIIMLESDLEKKLMGEKFEISYKSFQVILTI